MKKNNKSGNNTDKKSALSVNKKNNEEQVWYKESMKTFIDTISPLKKKEFKDISLVGNYGVGKTSFLKESLSKEKKYIRYIDAKSLISETDNLKNKLRSNFGYKKPKKPGDIKERELLNNFYQSTLKLIRLLFKFYLPFAISVCSIVIPFTFKESNSLFLLLLLTPFTLVFFILISWIAKISKPTKRKIIIIDNMDRISFDTFEKIMESLTYVKGNRVTVYDLLNIRTRYKERFGFESTNLFRDIEKYSGSVFNLESQIINEHYYVLQPLKANMDIEWFINFLKSHDFNNFRILSSLTKTIEKYIRVAEILEVDVEVLYFIKLLEYIDYIEYNKLRTDNNFIISPYSENIYTAREERKEINKDDYGEYFSNIVNDYLSGSSYRRLKSPIEGELKEFIFTLSDHESISANIDAIMSTPPLILIDTFDKMNSIEKRISTKSIMNHIANGKLAEILSVKLPYNLTDEIISENKDKIIGIFNNASIKEKLLIFINSMYYYNSKFRNIESRNSVILEEIKDSITEYQEPDFFKMLIYMQNKIIILFNNNKDILSEIISTKKDTRYGVLYDIIRYFPIESVKDLIRNYNYDPEYLYSDYNEYDGNKRTNYHEIDIQSIWWMGNMIYDENDSDKYKKVARHPGIKGKSIYLRGTPLDAKKIEDALNGKSI